MVTERRHGRPCRRRRRWHSRPAPRRRSLAGSPNRA